MRDDRFLSANGYAAVSPHAAVKASRRCRARVRAAMNQKLIRQVGRSQRLDILTTAQAARHP